MKFYKKGEGIDLSGKNLVGIILAFIMIVGTFAFFAGIVNFLVPGEKVSQISASNFEALATTIGELAESQDDLKGDNITFNLESGYVVVGFDKGKQGVIGKCGVSINIDKPLSDCGELACLCIYKREAFEQEKVSPMDCESYDVDYLFTHNVENANFAGDVKPNLPILSRRLSSGVQPEDLVIYGHCGVADSDALGVINLNFLGYSENGQKAILISPY